MCLWAFFSSLPLQFSNRRANKHERRVFNSIWHQERTDDGRHSVSSLQWSWNGTRPSCPDRSSHLWTQPDTSQRWWDTARACTALWFARREKRVLFVRAGTGATLQVGTMDRGPRGPLELRLHSWCLQGGLLIACSSTNWFSARSEPEWQGVKGGISCFCIYNSVASCVYVCMPRRVY